MKKISSMFQSVGYWTGVIVVGVVVGVSLQFVSAAWTNPTLPPPAGNVDAPINIGNNLQNKAGSLGISGFLNALSYISVGNPKGSSVPSGIRSEGDICTDAGGGKCLSSSGASDCSIEGSLDLTNGHSTGQSGFGTAETATVIGARMGDQVLVEGKSPCFPAIAYVSDKDTVEVYFPNPAGSTSCFSPPGKYNIRVIKAGCKF